MEGDVTLTRIIDAVRRWFAAEWADAMAIERAEQQGLVYDPTAATLAAEFDEPKNA